MRRRQGLLVAAALALSACPPEEEVVVPLDADGDGWEIGDDCDDTASLVNPDAVEVCDGIDNDCDGVIDTDALDIRSWYPDDDADGFGVTAEEVTSCAPLEGHVLAGGDCNDSDPSYYPGAPEPDCTDPRDLNCDGSVGFADADSDGFAACEDCDDTSDAAYPGGDEVCDGLDNDCNGQFDDVEDPPVWYADADGDGFGGTNLVLEGCDQPAGYLDTADDCDDLDPDVWPGATEVCDGVDNNCDGAVDESLGLTWYADADGDGFGNPSAPQTACTQPTGAVTNGLDCDDAVASTSPASFEICDGVDNDCDSSVDEAGALGGTAWYPDGDGDGLGVLGAVLVQCDQPTGYADNIDDCDDGDAGSTSIVDDGDCDGALTAADCDDNDPGSNVVAEDGDCDGLLTADDCDDSDAASTAIVDDADCDGTVTAADCDDNDPTSTVVANDGDCDTFEVPADCDDTDPLVYPGAPELPGDGIDNDCNGVVDDTNFTGVVEMPASGTVDGFQAGYWSALNGGGRAVSRLVLSQGCENPQLALFQHASADTSIQGSYYVTDAAGTDLAFTPYETYSGCNNCWLPHPVRLSVTLAPGTTYYVGFSNGNGGDMSGPSVYQDSTPRTVGIATFDDPRADFPASPSRGLPSTTVSWQNRWRIDCQ